MSMPALSRLTAEANPTTQPAKALITGARARRCARMLSTPISRPLFRFWWSYRCLTRTSGRCSRRLSPQLRQALLLGSFCFTPRF